MCVFIFIITIQKNSFLVFKKRRKKVNNLNILYHSRKYLYKSITPLHFYAWILMCLEGSEDFKLKEIETKNTKDGLSNYDDLVMGLSEK